jgi:xylulokinase
MLCYKNGALAREQVRDKYAKGNWDQFNQLVNNTPAGNNGHLGFYFPLPEIIPPNVVGNFFYSTSLVETDDKPPAEVDAIPASAHPRAILESQLLSIKLRLAQMLPPNAPPLQRLIVTGGSSSNQTIRQIAAVSPSRVC